jgi:hypothetical protein
LVTPRRSPGTTLLAQLGKVSRPPIDCVSPLTARELGDMRKRQVAAQVSDSLLRLAGNAEDRWCDLDAVLEVLLDERNVGKLDKVGRGISFAIRIKGALDQAGARGNPLLKLIDGKRMAAPAPPKLPTTLVDQWVEDGK